MKLNKTIIFYVSIISIFAVLMYWIVSIGIDLEPGKMEENVVIDQSGLKELPAHEVFWRTFTDTLHHPLAILLLQIFSIILIARIFGFLFTRVGQPTVIGEIIAGIVLGPSLLGWLLPEVSQFIFPAQSLNNLQFLSQVGLILFMFIIGMELDLKVLRNKAHDAVVISHASIIIPYFLGMVLAYFLYVDFAPTTTSFLSFALFMGIAMSITALPVLARVIQERNLTRTHLGTIAITCAAADDITAWCLLAVVIAIAQSGTVVSALFTILLAVGYVFFMLKILRPFLRRMGNIYYARETINKTVVAVVFLILLLSSYLTEIIGIHALFGAFMAGIIMPPNLNFRKVITEKVEDVTLVLLLPLFFVFTGLRTEIGLLNEWPLWVVCFWVIFVAVLGKFGGSAIAARFTGLSWKESLSIGALMNTRGLMELVVLNIGYDMGILSPEIFAMMVIMALATTYMTGPAIDWLEKLFPEKAEKVASVENEKVKPYKVLLSFGPPKKGATLLGLADQMTFKSQDRVEFTALHLTPNSEIDIRMANEFERQGFQPIKESASLLGIKLNTKYKVSDAVTDDITDEANKGEYDLLLVGASQSLFSKNELGGKVKSYLEDVKCSVGVLIDHNFRYARRIVFIVGRKSDFFMMKVVKHFIKNNNSLVTIIDLHHNISKDNGIWHEIVEINEQKAEAIKLENSESVNDSILINADLLLLSYETWQRKGSINKRLLQKTPSTLVLKKGSQD